VATVVATPKSGRDVTAPSAPPAFAATAGNQQVALSWGAATDDVGVVFYELRRDGTPIAYQEGRTFTDSALANGTAYTYTVVAVDAAGNTSAPSSVSATPADTVAPSTPANLTATPGNAQVSLAWDAATDDVGVTGYRVYRGGVLVASPSTPYYSDTGLGNGTTYAYTVVAVDAAANASAPTAPVTATPAVPNGSDLTPPSTPTGLAGTAGTNQVSLTWTASTDNVGVTGYRVYRGGTLVGSPAGPSFVDTGLTNGTAYSYTVVAVDAAGNPSPATGPVSVTPRDTQPPTVPTNIVLTKNALVHSITVTWTASTDNVGVAKYRVYRNGALAGQPTSTSFADLNLANGATYSYTVAAVDAAGNASAQSPAVSTYVS
jgi:chitodextrinase